MEDPAVQETGPPEAETGEDQHTDNQDPVFTQGFTPNVHTRETEMQQLHNAAFNNDQPIILTMPQICGTRINEYAGHAIAINAFPALCCTGQADITKPRNTEVSMEAWAAHLICLEGGYFAKHPHFQYWL